MYLYWSFREGNEKYKYMVFLCDEDLPIFFTINSEISNFIRMSQKLYRSQLEIYKKDYPEFLERDSYINCSKLHTNMTANQIDSQIRRDENCIKCDLLEQDRKRILKTISSSDLIEPFRKVQITQAINSTF